MSCVVIIFGCPAKRFTATKSLSDREVLSTTTLNQAFTHPQLMALYPPSEPSVGSQLTSWNGRNLFCSVELTKIDVSADFADTALRFTKSTARL
jgi:hypothetical protein